MPEADLYRSSLSCTAFVLVSTRVGLFARLPRRTTKWRHSRRNRTKALVISSSNGLVKARHLPVMRQRCGDSTFVFSIFMRFRMSALPTKGKRMGTTILATPFIGGNTRV